MFSFNGSPVRVRDDLRDAHRAIWSHFGQPGQVLDAARRHDILSAARAGTLSASDRLGYLATTLYDEPPGVTPDMVQAAISDQGDAAVVEAVSLVSMLAAVDNTHRALGADLEPLPEPAAGDPTYAVASGMKRRRTHVPMPRHSITVALELLPNENEAYAAACGPHYMTFAEMSSPVFARTPGLNRAQLETIASRTSFLNECFY